MAAARVGRAATAERRRRPLGRRPTSLLLAQSATPVVEVDADLVHEAGPKAHAAELLAWHFQQSPPAAPSHPSSPNADPEN